MLILSPGSIRGCGNAKVVKAVVAMVMVLHRERGALCRVLLGDCCLLTSAGQGRVLQFGPWASGDLGNMLFIYTTCWFPWERKPPFFASVSRALEAATPQFVYQ